MIKRINKKAQATLELTLVVGALLLFILGVVRVMGWFGSDLANRQQSFKTGRVLAGSLDSAGEQNSYSTPSVSLFK